MALGMVTACIFRNQGVRRRGAWKHSADCGPGRLRSALVYETICLLLLYAMTRAQVARLNKPFGGLCPQGIGSHLLWSAYEIQTQ
jgi:hypothetical protein